MKYLPLSISVLALTFVIFLSCTIPVTHAQTSASLTTQMGYGASGNQVSTLQNILINNAFLSLSSPTGFFGMLTVAAVRMYQQAHGIEQSGYVGPLTLASINGNVSTANGSGASDTLRAQLIAEINSLEAQLSAILAQGGTTAGGAEDDSGNNAGAGPGNGYISPPVDILPNPVPPVATTTPPILGISTTSQNVFSQSVLSVVTPPGLVVFRQGYPCPRDNSAATTAAYPNFPISVCQAQDMIGVANGTWTGGTVAHFIWENRYDSFRHVPAGPTPYPPALKSDGTRCDTHYDSFTLAEGATNAEIAYSAGAPAHNAAKMGYLDLAEAAGFADSDVYTRDAYAAQVNQLCTGTVTDYTGRVEDVVTDKVILPQGRLADDKVTPNIGFLMDYEAQDGRTNSVAHVTQEAAIAHYYGYPLSIYTNPLNGGTTVDNDFTPTTVPQIMANPNIKYFSVIIVPQAGDPDASLNAQLSVMNGGTLPATNASFLSKVMLTFQIGGGEYASPVTNAVTIHNDLVKWHIPAINVFPKGATFGGSVCPVTPQPISSLAALLGVTIKC